MPRVAYSLEEKQRLRQELVAALCGAIQKVSSRQTRAVFCDFPCTDIPPALYKKNDPHRRKKIRSAR